MEPRADPFIRHVRRVRALATAISSSSNSGMVTNKATQGLVAPVSKFQPIPLNLTSSSPPPTSSGQPDGGRRARHGSPSLYPSGQTRSAQVGLDAIFLEIIGPVRAVGGPNTSRMAPARDAHQPMTDTMPIQPSKGRTEASLRANASAARSDRMANAGAKSLMYLDEMTGVPR